MLRRAVSLFVVLCAACATFYGASDPVLMISIDGLKPEYVLQASGHGLKVPTLLRILREGSHAEGVRPVLPTVTYPNHTTLITGVTPAEHGVLNNMLFDPEHKFGGAWYWYAESIRVPTLWNAAHEAGLRTASVGWPVSVNAPGVDWLIPEYWRSSAEMSANDQDRYLMRAISRPVGGLAEMESRLGPYMAGNDTTDAGDATRARFALDILRRQRPDFMTIHLSALDGSEHEHGMFSPEANRTLEAVDGMVRQLMDAALANNPRAKIVIVSDHGFLNITHAVNLAIPFRKAGLLTDDASWKAQLWSASGVVAVMLHDPANASVRRQAKELLDKLAADKDNGIVRVLEEKDIAPYGGFPGAAFLIVMKPGYNMGYASSGPLVVEAKTVQGSHGYWQEYPEMRASFFIVGTGIAPGRDLGMIDIRQVAPTVAQILGVKLPDAKLPVLTVH